MTGHLVAQGGLDAASAPVIGVVVETKCQFRQELNFPVIVDTGIKLTKLGRTSVRYEIGLFRQGKVRAGRLRTFCPRLYRPKKPAANTDTRTDPRRTGGHRRLKKGAPPNDGAPPGKFGYAA